MGICSSGVTAETKRSTALDLRLAVDREDAAAAVRLLLLGAGGGGKSTLRAQFRIGFGKGFPDADRRAHLPVMQQAAVDAMRTLLARPEADLQPTLLVRRAGGPRTERC
jgi:hypothetical protein